MVDAEDVDRRTDPKSSSNALASMPLGSMGSSPGSGYCGGIHAAAWRMEVRVARDPVLAPRQMWPATTMPVQE